MKNKYRIYTVKFNFKHDSNLVEGIIYIIYMHM